MTTDNNRLTALSADEHRAQYAACRHREARSAQRSVESAIFCFTARWPHSRLPASCSFPGRCRSSVSSDRSAFFFVGFVGQPISAAIFNHWGDRIGRKATLIVTLLVTGIATAAIGLIPTYDSIGIWGAVLLTVIRLIQGIGVGGEWGGSGPVGDGMGAHGQESRFPLGLAAIRRARRTVPGQRGRAGCSVGYRATSSIRGAGVSRSSSA